jgi:RimJ/RimL family protein N-acetyltransferase
VVQLLEEGASCDLPILGRLDGANGWRAPAVPRQHGPVDPVEITAGRLHLRPWQAFDAEALQGALGDPEVVRWTGLPSRPALEWITQTYPGRWADGTGAGFAVLDATTAELLGGVDLHGVDAADGTAELGWFGVPQARGRGIATEAVQVLCRWAFDALGLHRLTAQVVVGNWASRALAEKAGFTVEGVLRDAPAPGGRRADTWLASLLVTDQVLDRRAFPPLGRPTDGVVALRHLRETDVPVVQRACDDAGSARWLPLPVPYTEQDARSWALRLVPSEWADGKVASAAVVDAGTDDLLGAVGLTPGRDRSGEVGYWTAPWARGRGVAVRAARLHTAWAVDALGLARVELLTDVGNHASQRVAAKAGFVREGVARAVRAEPRGTARVDMVVWAHVP